MIFGKLLRWCLCIVYYKSNEFVVFNQSVEFGCCRFYLNKMFLLVFVCYYVTLVGCLLNVFLKEFRGIFIQMYYLIFLYKSIYIIFQCIFTYYDHGSTFIRFRYFVPVEFLFFNYIGGLYVVYCVYLAQ